MNKVRNPASHYHYWVYEDTEDGDGKLVKNITAFTSRKTCHRHARKAGADVMVRLCHIDHQKEGEDA